MKTFKRIRKLQEAVRFACNKDDVVVADIATDHGYLAEALSKQNWVSKIIATDISKKCLSKLERLIERCDLKKIETRLGDGLEPIEKVDIAAIAGVGGFEIIKMLERQNSSSNGNKCDLFVLQPAQNMLELREWVFDHKIKVVKDYVIEDADRFYPILIVDVSREEINEKSIKNLWIGRDAESEVEDYKLFLKDQLEYLKFLEELSQERIMQDKVLQDKYELKKLIENELGLC